MITWSLRPLNFIVLSGVLLGACTIHLGGSPPGGESPPASPSAQATTTQPPTATAPPSATIIPTATPTSPPTGTSTPTATSGPSPTPSPIPLAAGDPRQGLNLSVPEYKDDFSQRFLWYEFSSPDAGEVLWFDGEMRAIDAASDGAIWWSTSNAQGGNLYLEIDARFAACSGKDAAGIGIRIGNGGYDRGYGLEISCDGYYRLRKFISNAQPQELLPWTLSTAIETGPEALNRIGFLARGSALHGFANGEILNSDPVEDLDYVLGVFGLYAFAADTPGIQITFDDFALWSAPIQP